MQGRTGTRDFVILKALAVMRNNIAKYLRGDGGSENPVCSVLTFLVVS